MVLGSMRRDMAVVYQDAAGGIRLHERRDDALC